MNDTQLSVILVVANVALLVSCCIFLHRARRLNQDTRRLLNEVRKALAEMEPEAPGGG